MEPFVHQSRLIIRITLDLHTMKHYLCYILISAPESHQHLMDTSTNIVEDITQKENIGKYCKFNN